ncbi:hypothetical protein, partial [Chelatococcus sp.]|uniref:hypothetical protein n=1 Tax=Chelatococcus sp. TaxID=1953771 RepID=UPI0025BB19C0
GISLAFRCRNDFHYRGKGEVGAPQDSLAGRDPAGVDGRLGGLGTNQAEHDAFKHERINESYKEVGRYRAWGLL